MPLTWTPLTTALLVVGAVLWLNSLATAIRGRDMGAGLRIVILVLHLVATPLGAYLILR